MTLVVWARWVRAMQGRRERSYAVHMGATEDAAACVPSAARRHRLHFRFELLGERGVERLWDAAEVERLDEDARVSLLVPRAAAEEAPQLVFQRPGAQCGLFLQRAERA